MTATENALEQRSWVRDLIILGVWLALPYLVVGVFWADAHRQHLSKLHGLDATASYVGEVIAWPVLIFADVNLE
ncbi:hypothetical protein BJ993_001812 [Nocardioides aromaticivorans]|uniref:Uncharacterized protein n=1 Tax=Nocardioides aromaticivorans TaxID=200618 RepID=A0A7Z0CND5_9ACTN|nr:hypothetical protein [Nocardioides aromaticivorans]NYI44732.1 hypothetical protein [Nocardioides aromaticivorans]